ncbi:MAG TPA: hypothetical protein VIB48_14850 [Acidimicrobiia bacterium]|jgi:hypothetical protein
MTTTEFLDYLAESTTTHGLAAQLASAVAERRRLDAYLAFEAPGAPAPTPRAA